MLHRGYNAVFNQFHDELVGLTAAKPFLAPLVMLENFGEVDGAHHVQHPPEADNPSPQHLTDYTAGALVQPLVQPENLGTYQDKLKDRTEWKWKGNRSTRYWAFNRLGLVLRYRNKWSALIHRTFVVQAYRLAEERSNRQDCEEANLHLLDPEALEQLIKLAPMRRYMVANTNRKFLEE